MTARWSAKRAALVRNLNRKVRRHDRQFASGLAVRGGRELLQLPAERTDRQE